MQLANFFTASRIVLAPIFFVVYFLPNYFNISPKITLVILIPLFAYMQFTDFLDGYVARKYNMVSDFGKLFDPFADVLANMAVLFCFTIDGLIPSIFFLIILYREVSIVFVRMLAVKKGLIIGAKMLGKIKTVLYITVGGVSIFIKLCMVYSFFGKNITATLIASNLVLYSLAVVFSILSFYFYLMDYKKYSNIKG
ncbi:MAG: CDP-diacylglycerol--glycerol-3-phosphate 3-phosphatidyltransferase [Treponema sp.]